MAPAVQYPREETGLFQGTCYFMAATPLDCRASVVEYGGPGLAITRSRARRRAARQSGEDSVFFRRGSASVRARMKFTHLRLAVLALGTASLIFSTG